MHRQSPEVLGWVPGDHNKVNIAIRGVSGMFWFPNAYERHTYTILLLSADSIVSEKAMYIP